MMIVVGPDGGCEQGAVNKEGITSSYLARPEATVGQRQGLE